jgi:predicted DNA-binding transcriptional regulator YafY
MERNKTVHLFKLMEKLYHGDTLYPQDEVLLSEFEVDERTMRRYLEQIHSLYSGVIVTQKVQMLIDGRKVTTYRVLDKQKDASEIFSFFLDNSKDLGWLLHFVHENDPLLFKDQEHKKAFQDLIKRDENTFLFVNSPFENMDNEAISKIFYDARAAIQRHEYRKIHYDYGDSKTFVVKCLKLIYMNNNWYLAAEDEAGSVRILRLAFISAMGYADKSTFQPSSVEHYAQYFQKIQNPMTLNKSTTVAHLRASAKIARYYKPEMKPFFLSQKIDSLNKDGSIDFTVEYTQALEILPFVKQWLPDIEILSPDSLKEIFKKELLKALSKINSTHN